MTADIRLAREPVGAQSLPVHVPSCKAGFYPCFLHFPKLQGMEEKDSKLLGEKSGLGLCCPMSPPWKPVFYLSPLKGS